MTTTRYATMADRLAANVTVNDDTGCFTWLGNVNNSGYARLSVRCCGKVKKVYAYRLSVEMATGERVPEGMQVDHKCYNTRCVNPQHLEVVTPTENLRRRRSVAAAA